MKYSDEYPFINYIKVPESKGVSYARNLGVSMVESLFVVLLDADDKIGNCYLFYAEKILRDGFDIANPDAIHFGTSDSRWNVPEFVSLEMMLKKNYVHTAAAFRRNCWVKVEGINERMENWQDYDFWIRILATGTKIKKLHGDHFYYRKHGYGKSDDSGKRKEEIMSYLRSKHATLY